MKNSRFLFMVFLLMLLALTTMGIAYGLWAETLVINGTVNTGEVDARWIMQGTGCFEFYPWPGGGNFGEYEDKDVGQWNIGIDSVDDRILYITVENGYPSYAVDCSLKFEVEGTIPVYGRGTTVAPVSPNLTNCLLSGNSQKTLACDEMTVIFTDNIGVQLHPGDIAASNVMFHIEQPAAELATYEFAVGVCLGQWNEGATADECFAAAPLQLP